MSVADTVPGSLTGTYPDFGGRSPEAQGLLHRTSGNGSCLLLLSTPFCLTHRCPEFSLDIP